MLDDLKHIYRRDTADALGAVERQWMQYKHALPCDWKPERPIHNVVVVAMGDSGLAARLFRSWPGVDVPFEIVQDYQLPEYVQAHTLVIIVSYSGNTEEVVSCFQQALEVDMTLKQQPMLVAISAGGTVEEMAHAHKVAHIELPRNITPRLAFGYQLRALVEVFERTPLLGTAALRNVEQAADWLREHVSSWRPEIATKDNLPKQIARELAGRSIVIYSGPKLAAVAYKWKLDCNENAKQIAWWNTLPECSHNECIGWSKQPVQKPYAVIDLRSRLEHPRVQQRFEVTERLLSGLRPSPVVVEAKGDDLLHQLLYLSALGDYVSIYLALLANTDPTPVELVERCKNVLEK